MVRTVLFAFCVFSCLLLSGCGGQGGAPQVGVVVSGKLLKGGQPVTLENYSDGYNYYEISLTPVDEGGQGGNGNADGAGDFKIHNVKPGSYRVGVIQIVDADASNDALEGKYAVTDFTVQVEEGKELTIDLDELGSSGKK